MDVADESAPMLSDWYSRLFSASWIEYVIDSLPDGQTDREAAFLAEKLPLETDSCVLDIGSGTGRHSVRLMQRGVRTIGIDLSAECLRRACRDAMDSASPCTFVRADMRMLPFRSEMFSHAICLFTSFGYFGSAQGDE